MYDITRRLIARGYWDQNNGDGNDSGGSGGGNDDNKSGDTNDNASGDGNDDDADGDDDGSDDKSKDKDKPTEKEAKLIKEVMSKKGKIKELQGELDDVKDKLKAFDGLDAEELRALVQKNADAEQKKLEDKGEWDKLKKQMSDAHAKDMKGVRDENAKLKNDLAEKDALIEQLTVGHAFDSSKYIKDELTLPANKARKLYGSHFDIEDGRTVGYDKPRGESGRVQLVGADGDALLFDDAMVKIIDADPDRDNLKRSKAKPGAGSKTTPTKGKSDAPKATGLSRIQAAVDAGKIGAMKRP